MSRVARQASFIASSSSSPYFTLSGSKTPFPVLHLAYSMSALDQSRLEYKSFKVCIVPQLNLLPVVALHPLVHSKRYILRLQMGAEEQIL